MSDGYTREQADAWLQHLQLTDGKSGYGKAAADSIVVHVCMKWPGKQLTGQDSLPCGWHEDVGTNKAANH